MENVNCLFCSFPWDLFLFLLLLGLLLWWLLSTLIGKRWKSKVDGLEAEIANLKAEYSKLGKDYDAKIALVQKDLDECRKSAAAVPLMATSQPVRKDDLKIVEGIGPKIEELFNDAGIYSFDQLAAADPSRLKQILDAAGPRFQMHEPATWPKQAAMARDGKWDELKKWQDEMKGGRPD